MTENTPGPIEALRALRVLTPCTLHDLAALAGALVEQAGIVPLNAAARARPSGRTIRFYVSRGLVSPPQGKGTSAVYAYRHLLQVIAVKLRQMEGASLEALAQEFQELTGDVLERRVAARLGPAIPAPESLRALTRRGGRRQRPADVSLQPVRQVRVPLEPGVALVLDETHPAAADRRQLAALAEDLRAELRRRAMHLPDSTHDGEQP